MTFRKTYIALTATLAAATLSNTEARAESNPSSGLVALSGNVSSLEEGAMEGVLVSAKKDGSTITTTVVSDDKGHFSFPASRLSPGHYSLKIRAIGYYLDGPRAADVTGSSATAADIKLKKTDNIATQMTSAEWLDSMPGTDLQKRFLQNCVVCHTLQRVVSSTHTADEFQKLILKMGTFAPGSVAGRVQLLAPGPRSNRGAINSAGPMLKAAADYLANVNLSMHAKWTYPLVALPRPKGRATHVIITSYDLPRKDAEPHDVILTPDGKVWYSDFGSQYIGELDTKSGKVTDYAVPVLKEEEPRGVLDLKPGPNGNLWITMMYQAGLAKFDIATKKMTSYPVPAEWQTGSTQIGMVAPTHADVDGKVWTNDQENHSILRLDVNTGKWENLGVPKGEDGVVLNSYDIVTNTDNSLYLFDFNGGRIGKIDAKTTQFRTWPTSIPYSRPRRGSFNNGKLWFAEYNGNAVGSFDPKTNSMKEWQLPTKWTWPYEALHNDKGDVWAVSTLTDRMTRLIPDKNEFVEYLMPETTNMRNVTYDKDRNAIWVGSNYGDAILEVQPLD